MIRLLLILLFASQAFATKDSLSGPTVNWDNNLSGIAAGSANLDYNLGGRVYSQIGWPSKTYNTVVLDSSYGKTLSAWNITSITDGNTIDSCFIYYYNDQAPGSTPEVACYGMPSNWREGTKTVAAREDSMSTQRSRGYGTMIDGSTVAKADSAWSAGEKIGTRYLTTTNVVTQNTWYRWDVTAMVLDSHAAGKNFVSFMFYDTSYPANSGNERCTMVLSEAGTTLPYMLVYHSLHIPPDSTFVRVNVTVASVPAPDVPVFFSIVSTRNIVPQQLSLFSSDSTTNLYWVYDSLVVGLTTSTLYGWVIDDWNTIPDSFYVAQESAPDYINSDSVFIVDEQWNSDFSVCQPVTDWDLWNCSIIDTMPPILTSTNPAQMREPDALRFDPRITNPNQAYTIRYCVDYGTAAGDPEHRYNDNILLWASAPTPQGPCTYQDTVWYDSLGFLAPLRMEDPDLLLVGPPLNKWIMVGENHNISEEYHVALLYADSLNQEVWTLYGDIPLLEPSALGGPTNWLNNEQASTALCFNATEDTAHCAFEAFSGAIGGITMFSATGMAISFNGTGSYVGDTLGLDWHLLDSTGAINDANPSPIVTYSFSTIDSSTIPDDLEYLNGELGLVNHLGGGPSAFYKGTNPGNLTKQSTDSAKLASAFHRDPVSGDLIGSYISSFSDTTGGLYSQDSLWLFRPRNFDASRMAGTEFTVQTRAGKLGSHFRLRGGECLAYNGKLTMFSNQLITGSISIMSRDSFNTGVAVDVWMRSKLSSIDGGVPHINLWVGDDTLQTYDGYNGDFGGNWEWTSTKKGYSMLVHPTSCRFYKDSTGISRATVGSKFAVSSDTIGTQHKWTILYAPDDSLKCLVDGVVRRATKAATTPWVGTYKRFGISQGEQRGKSNYWGGVTEIDAIRVRKYIGSDGVATPTDELWFVGGNQADSGWKKLSEWPGGW